MMMLTARQDVICLSKFCPPNASDARKHHRNQDGLVYFLKSFGKNFKFSVTSNLAVYVLNIDEK